MVNTQRDKSTDDVVTVKTIVISGRGLAVNDRADDIQDLSTRLNIKLINGSLNLISRKPVYLDTKKAIYFNGSDFYYWNGTIGGIPVIINRWWGCPAHVFEIFS